MSVTADRLTSAELGMTREAAPGALRLVRDLLKQGMPVELLPYACSLAVELEAACCERDERS